MKIVSKIQKDVLIKSEIDRSISEINVLMGIVKDFREDIKVGIKSGRVIS